jgi:hypothetical protein
MSAIDRWKGLVKSLRRAPSHDTAHEIARIWDTRPRQAQRQLSGCQPFQQKKSNNDGKRKGQSCLTDALLGVTSFSAFEKPSR